MARIQTGGSIMNLKREIIITGGGLAGLALASALRSYEVPVTVQEAGTYPRHRVCGEFISGVTLETLDALGISGTFNDALHHRSIAWFDQGRSIHRATLKHPALGISRHRLDQRLAAHFQAAGGTIHTGVRSRPEAAAGAVWAAGRPPAQGPWIGLKLHARGIPMVSDLEMHSGANGYAGLAGVEEGWTNVCGLFRLDRSLRGRPGELLATYLAAGGQHDLAEQIRSSEVRDGSACAVAGFRLGRQQPLPGVLTLGDAASMIPPFTGNGMSMAFQSAEIAVAPLLAWSRGSLTWQQARNVVALAVQRRFRRRLMMAQSVHPLLFRSSGRACVRALASTGVLPFQTLLASVR
jgi:2-polyprenyl-6-methoxyphenol hydroxylase-like FAD-dependent oxidoreductase